MAYSDSEARDESVQELKFLATLTFYRRVLSENPLVEYMRMPGSRIQLKRALIVCERKPKCPSFSVVAAKSTSRFSDDPTM